MASDGLVREDRAKSCEIEITAEMVEAGVQVYCTRDSRFDSDEDIVTRIFESMLAAIAR
jgi:hypothetical protein